MKTSRSMSNADKCDVAPPKKKAKTSPGADRNWRSKLTCINQYRLHVLKEQINTDCKFIIGPENGETKTVGAHKSFIMCASEVFEAMFNTQGMVESLSGEVRVTDVTHDTFCQLLRYIYGDTDLKLNFTEAYRLYMASQKYMIGPLTAKCLADMKQTVSSEDVWLALKVARQYDIDIEKICIDFIQNSTYNCIASPQFESADEESIELLVKQDKLIVENESILLNAVLNWARHETQRRNLNCLNDSDIRTVLRPKILQHIRFLTFSKNELQLGPFKSTWLNSREKVKIRKFIEKGVIDVGEVSLSPSIKERCESIPPKLIALYDEGNVSSQCSFFVRPNNDKASIIIKPRINFELHGIIVKSRNGLNYTENIDFKILQVINLESVKIFSIKFIEQRKKTDDVSTVIFPRPIKLYSGFKYGLTAKFNLTGKYVTACLGTGTYSCREFEVTCNRQLYHTFFKSLLIKPLSVA